METCKPIETSFDVKSKLLTLSYEKFVNVQKEMEGVPHKAGVRSLMYAMMDTGRIFHLRWVQWVNIYQRPVDRIGWPWNASWSIWRALWTFNLCLEGKCIVLRGFFDTDWAGDTNNRRSTMGYVFFVGVGVISWKCKKQPTIALSRMKAECMATSYCTNESVWLRRLWADVRYVQDGPTSIMCDNQWCITFANNHTHHSCTKHIDVQHHFIKDILKNQDIYLKYCSTEDMIADVLTKPLPNYRHKKLIRPIDIETFYYSQNGIVKCRALDCL